MGLITQIPPADQPSVLKNGDSLFRWCCGCGLRHVWIFDIVRGKSSEDDKVLIYGARDDWASDAMREIKRLRKRIKELKQLEQPDKEKGK